MTQYIYKTTTELKALRDSNSEWLWLCKLYAHWEAYDKVYEFKLNEEKNKTKCNPQETVKQESDPAGLKTFSNRNCTGQTAEQKPRDENDELDRGRKDSSALENVNDLSVTPIWVIFVVASVFIFIGGLVIGGICRRPPVQVPAEPTDVQTDAHFYEKVSYEFIPRVLNKNILIFL